MHRVVILLLTFIILIGCHGNPIDSTQIPRVDISGTLEALPSNPNIQSSQIVLQAYFEAYNSHDLTGVLATLAETFAYGDCDFAKHQMLVFETKADLSIWLGSKFAAEDQFLVIDIIIAPPEGSPAKDPRLATVQVIRTNKTLNRLALEKQSLFKIVLNPEGNRIQYLNTYGNVDCETGR